ARSSGGRGLAADLLGPGLVASGWPLLAVVALVSAIVLSHSRGGFASAGIGTLVLLGQILATGRFSRTAKLAVAGMAVIVAALMVVVSGATTLGRLGQTALEHEERTRVYAIVRAGIADRPWIGHGYGNFDFASRPYHDGSVVSNYDKAHDD